MLFLNNFKNNIVISMLLGHNSYKEKHIWRLLNEANELFNDDYHINLIVIKYNICTSDKM